jgi:hypothetical protein
MNPVGENISNVQHQEQRPHSSQSLPVLHSEEAATVSLSRTKNRLTVLDEMNSSSSSLSSECSIHYDDESDMSLEDVMGGNAAESDED